MIGIVGGRTSNVLVGLFHFVGVLHKESEKRSRLVRFFGDELVFVGSLHSLACLLALGVRVLYAKPQRFFTDAQPHMTSQEQTGFVVSDLFRAPEHHPHEAERTKNGELLTALNANMAYPTAP